MVSWICHLLISFMESYQIQRSNGMEICVPIFRGQILAQNFPTHHPPLSPAPKRTLEGLECVSGKLNPRLWDEFPGVCKHQSVAWFCGGWWLELELSVSEGCIGGWLLPRAREACGIATLCRFFLPFARKLRPACHERQTASGGPPQLNPLGPGAERDGFGIPRSLWQMIWRCMVWM